MHLDHFVSEYFKMDNDLPFLMLCALRLRRHWRQINSASKIEKRNINGRADVHL